jgi:hypothetical protein
MSSSLFPPLRFPRSAQVASTRDVDGCTASYVVEVAAKCVQGFLNRFRSLETIDARYFMS